jgi:hypothetical protein
MLANESTKKVANMRWKWQALVKSSTMLFSARCPMVRLVLLIRRSFWEGARTLAARGLEEPFFPVVLLCQFFVLAGNRFWFYILMYVT